MTTEKQPPLRIWDNPETADRYTILPPASDKEGKDASGWTGLGSSRDPKGLSYHVFGVKAGKHLGKRITWDKLPPAVQRLCEREWPQHVTVPVLTGEQERALDWFRDRHGKDWRDVLRVAWYTGKDANLRDGAFLRQIRNTFGPLWLDTFEALRS